MKGKYFIKYINEILVRDWTDQLSCIVYLKKKNGYKIPNEISYLFHNYCPYNQIYNHSDSLQQDPHKWLRSGMDWVSIRLYLEIKKNMRKKYLYPV